MTGCADWWGSALSSVAARYEVCESETVKREQPVKREHQTSREPQTSRSNLPGPEPEPVEDQGQIESNCLCDACQLSAPSEVKEHVPEGECLLGISLLWSGPIL